MSKVVFCMLQILEYFIIVNQSKLKCEIPNNIIEQTFQIIFLDDVKVIVCIMVKLQLIFLL